MLPEHQDLLSWVCTDNLGTRHATLFDPANQSSEKAALKAQVAIEAGSRMILIGGSTDTSEIKVHSMVQAIQKALELRVWAATQDATEDENFWKVPVILFPGGAHALSASADGILFMMLMNSRNPQFLVGEQVRGAVWLDESGVEMLPTGYVICEPGGKVGEVGEADLLSTEEEIKAHAICAKGFGMEILYLEAGSGASSPISPKLIKAGSTSENCLFVGGGIRSAEQAKAAKDAGASWIVTGTIVEEHEDMNDLRQALSNLISGLN
ncbi:MAG: geranylgeranylglyceryl/heptaprenylglyceryl phosphate synthase [Candidatus Thalassarchaeaceae archaeon]|nr:geranylgeranylglyceryl/heptaprenylglyceryl phosphate synthase [Candidatus Thalassarchaeaceae archaeon]